MVPRNSITSLVNRDSETQSPRAHSTAHGPAPPLPVWHKCQQVPSTRSRGLYNCTQLRIYGLLRDYGNLHEYLKSLFSPPRPPYLPCLPWELRGRTCVFQMGDQLDLT